MLALTAGLIGFVTLEIAAVAKDPVGLGLLFSSDVDGVADARLVEPALHIPPLYMAAAASAGAGAIFAFPDAPMPVLVRWLVSLLLAAFLLLTTWDMRRRRGTLAVYIRLRREEIGFEPRGDVIEVPKLVFLVMNQPTPIVWLLTSVALLIGGLLLLPYESWAVMLPLITLAIAIFWLWVRNRRSPWEPLARHLRWVSLRNGEELVEPLEHALDLDPEVVLLRQAADAMVARLMRNSG